MNRRKFIQHGFKAGATMALGAYPFQAWTSPTDNQSLTVLHTNDVHSRLDPFPLNDAKYPGMGGVAQRKMVLDQIRATQKSTLLLDCGDMFQGTPYFNFFKGEAEIKAMNDLGYDAGTLGNHDFDLGVENLATQLSHAKFEIVNCNYNFTGTALEHLVKPYIIKKIAHMKVGITGLGIELNGLVPEILHKGIIYNKPNEKLQEICDILFYKKKCDLIICLSHLGFDYKDDKVSDMLIARTTRHLDVLLGGHTHTFLDEVKIVENKFNQHVLVNQVGFGGIVLGRLNFDISQQKIRYKHQGQESGILIK